MNLLKNPETGQEEIFATIWKAIPPGSLENILGDTAVKIPTKILENISRNYFKKSQRYGMNPANICISREELLQKPCEKLLNELPGKFWKESRKKNLWENPSKSLKILGRKLDKTSIRICRNSQWNFKSKSQKEEILSNFWWILEGFKNKLPEDRTLDNLLRKNYWINTIFQNHMFSLGMRKHELIFSKIMLRVCGLDSLWTFLNGNQVSSAKAYKYECKNDQLRDEWSIEG